MGIDGCVFLSIRMFVKIHMYAEESQRWMKDIEREDSYIKICSVVPLFYDKFVLLAF